METPLEKLEDIITELKNSVKQDDDETPSPFLKGKIAGYSIVLELIKIMRRS
jgi:hypothetical protein